jgi:hypothetical protein
MALIITDNSGQQGIIGDVRFKLSQFASLILSQHPYLKKPCFRACTQAKIRL